MYVSPVPLDVISVTFSFVNGDPLTIQAIEPPLILQVKVAVDPSVALTDVGVLVIAEKWIKQQNNQLYT